MKSAILEFNHATRLCKDLKFSEAIPIFRGCVHRFKQEGEHERALYAYELLARCQEKLKKYRDSITTWVVCVAYALIKGHKEKLSLYVDRFCRDKSWYDKKREGLISSLYDAVLRLTQEKGVTIKLPFELICEEIDHYVKYRMKKDELVCIEILLARADEDPFYYSLGHILKALLMERQIRIKAQWVSLNDLFKSVVQSFVNTSDPQMEKLMKHLMEGLKTLDEIDEYSAKKLFKISLFFYHHGQLRIQMKILTMLNGTEDPYKKIRYNSYLIRTLVDVGHFKNVIKLSQETEKLIKVCEEKEINEGSKYCPKDHDEYDLESLKCFYRLMESYFYLESNQHEKCHRRLLQTHEELSKHLKKSSSSSNKRSRKTHHLEELYCLCSHYLSILYYQQGGLEEGLQYAIEVMDTLKGTPVQIRELVPQSKEFLILGDIYQSMGNIQKSGLYYNKGIQSCLYSRCRTGCIVFLLRQGILEKRKNDFIESLKYFKVVDQLLEYYFDEHDWGKKDELDYMTILHIHFLLEQSDLYLKLKKFEDSFNSLRYGKQCIRTNNLQKSSNMSIKSILFLSDEYEGKLKYILSKNKLSNNNDDDESKEELRNSLKKILDDDTNMISRLYQSKILFLLCQSYIPKKYINSSSSSSSQKESSTTSNKEKKIHKMINLCISKSVASIPVITKPIFSAASTVLPNPFEKTYFSNMSMGIRLRHEKYILLRNQVFELQKNFQKCSKKMKILVNVLRFEKTKKNSSSSSLPYIITDKSNNNNNNEGGGGGRGGIMNKSLLKNIKKILPDDYVVFSLCLSHDFSSILFTRIEKTKNITVREVPLILKLTDLYKYTQKTPFYGILRKNFDQQKKKKHNNDEQKTKTNSNFYQINENIDISKEKNLLYVALRELEYVIFESDKTLKEAKLNKPKSQVQKGIWWSQRHTIDEQMRDLSTMIENTIWFNNSIVKEGEEEEEEEGEFQPVMDTYPTNKHYILVLDKLLQKLPFEIMPIFRNCSVSRIPSLMMLYTHLINHKQMSKAKINKTFYIVNPDGTLQKTQNKFIEHFTNEQKKFNWKGFLGVSPTAIEFDNAMKKFDVVIYMGHGAGEGIIHSENVRTAKKSPKLTMIMGCSSGSLKENGEFEPSGTIMNYLLSGCHCIMANLWDVTDGDCDRLSHFVIKKWVNQNTNSLRTYSINHFVPKGRKECKLKYLVGGACVCYGLPVYPVM